MSWTHIFVTPEFWLGVPSGAVLAATPALIAARSLRTSDTRKAAHDEKMQDRKDEREDKLRQDENLYSVASEFAEVCSDILMNSVDIKGAFNSIRDAFYNRAGIADPNVDNKVDHATKMAEGTKRIGVPFNKMRLVAPNNVLEAATQLNAAALAVLRTTTEPFAAPVTVATAGDLLENFINVFREEIGRDPYTQSTSNRAVASFMETLKKQVDDYMEQAKVDMKAAGFKSTPWDKPGDKSSERGSVPVRSLNVGDDISLPNGTGSIGLRSTIRGFNEKRTQMTVFVQKSGKTVTLNVGPDQQFDRV